MFDYEKEADDAFHDPTVEPKGNKTLATTRGLMNLGALAFLTLGLCMLFAGYPMLVYLRPRDHNLSTLNNTGQVGGISGVRTTLIDPDTPESVYTRTSVDGKTQLKLVFSDEFNIDGRTFWPGDDPFWTAEDLHYWATSDYEWYSPEAITTANGSLVITLSETPTHNLNFRSGLMNTWNKFCFQGGQIEVRIMLPGRPDVMGLWPAAWTAANIIRAGYGATTDGLWPYSYNSCDVGTLKNQTYPASQGGGPLAAETTGVVLQYGPALSYLPGQRLSACTCPNSDDHPGPKNSDGTWVGRSGAEIDIIEAAARGQRGANGSTSMSLQVAPFDAGYWLPNSTSDWATFYTPNTEPNEYRGSVYQQAASGLGNTSYEAYELTGQQFSSYAFEYIPGTSTQSHVTWLIDGERQWRLGSTGLGPDEQTEIGPRVVPTEPMYIILNLGISRNFVSIDWENLEFPAHMYVDYVRVWQDPSKIAVGCDREYGTAAYIEKHLEAYTNPNLTTWQRPRSEGGYGSKV
ncbi:glycoside hydrolase family 16 protein [Tilletiaria anomala UBC 951]|uniref:Glycoside hydrolase family 16 protein n=1 Tax=Tilletiaria anomala (strain ATCC 24038 / CBS 436.72 / UBC 951) TaxID=1037660 RepID=A0A066WHC5_TILAU|nr:glycoside hydrolase family 16 protein [Tilletiaria anomala UBC 951]KDN53226.1 glycoside hydrolase family 16 protein [Tilletiaria anomala UBC 951]